MGSVLYQVMWSIKWMGYHMLVHWKLIQVVWVFFFFPLRFLEEYAKYNLTFWALTTGNEPSAGQITNYRSFPTHYAEQTIITSRNYHNRLRSIFCLTVVSRLWASPLRSRGTGWLWTWALPCTPRRTHTHTSSYWMTTACCCLTGPKW